MSARNGHPLAVELWAILRGRSQRDRRLVFDALQPRLANEATTEKQEQALAAGRRYLKLYGASPSRRQYDYFRDSQPDRGEWPSGQLIRNAFGDWPSFRSALEGGAPMPDVLGRRLTSKGRRVPRATLVNALREWAASVPEDQPLREREFLEWCRAHNSRCSDFRDRLPVSGATWISRVGLWPEALAEIGELHRGASALGKDRPPVNSGHGEGNEGHADPRRHPHQSPLKQLPVRLENEPLPPAPRGGKYSVEELLPWPRWAATGLSPEQAVDWSEEDYEQLRQTIISAARAEGRVLRVPTSSTLVRRLGGSWQLVKLRCGLIGEGDLRTQITDRLTDDKIAADFRAAAAALGREMSRAAYQRWRERELRRVRERDSRARVASEAVVRSRFGGPSLSWEEAKRHVGIGSAPASRARADSAHEAGRQVGVQ